MKFYDVNGHEIREGDHLRLAGKPGFSSAIVEVARDARGALSVKTVDGRAALPLLLTFYKAEVVKVYASTDGRAA